MILFSHKDDCKHGFKVTNFICTWAIVHHLYHGDINPLWKVDVRIHLPIFIQVGMKVECTDLMDPRLVCVSTINRVVNRWNPFQILELLISAFLLCKWKLVLLCISIGFFGVQTWDDCTTPPCLVVECFLLHKRCLHSFLTAIFSDAISVIDFVFNYTVPLLISVEYHLHKASISDCWKSTLTVGRKTTISGWTVKALTYTQ